MRLLDYKRKNDTAHLTLLGEVLGKCAIKGQPQTSPLIYTSYVTALSSKLSVFARLKKSLILSDFQTCVCVWWIRKSLFASASHYRSFNRDSLTNPN